ncbi:MAG: 16S rRNA processing protein RimM [Ammonifex sp.]|nr:MAG: 16S rRNA processing protein RimM [Ammonifex sp.]
MPPLFITIGEIVAPHGYRGAVRVLPLTDFPQRFLTMATATVNNGKKKETYTIERADRHKQFILLKFNEIKDLDAAERLRGAFIEVPREEVVPLPPGRYYIFDVIGLKVWSEDGTYLGELNDVFQTGANDVYSILTADGKEILIPALKEVVKMIDIPGGRMVVKLPEGLL